jgi:uncharacterized protein YjbI with pentapeptide repeats
MKKGQLDQVKKRWKELEKLSQNALDFISASSAQEQVSNIDAFFDGVADLILDEDGLLDDSPQARAILEGRASAILLASNASGKSTVLRFLSRSRLLTPLKRDRVLGDVILDGAGGYQEDRDYGVRVIDLGVMLAGADLSYTDLRWTDLSDANLLRASLNGCDLVKANLARTILYEATLAGTDLQDTRLFYGSVETASPRSRTEIPDYRTGAFTGAVIENADFTGAQRMSEEQRYYCCLWGGSRTRETIPGGCKGIPNLLGDPRPRNTALEGDKVSPPLLEQLLEQLDSNVLKIENLFGQGSNKIKKFTKRLRKRHD